MTSFSSRASHRIAFFFALHRGQASFHRDLLSSIVQAKKCLQNIVFAMKFFGSSSLLLCVLALASTVFTSSFNLSPRIMNLATKRIAAAAIVTFGLTGMPDQIFSFSTAAVASAAAAETKSIFDGMYSDPNHPGCMVNFSNHIPSHAGIFPLPNFFFSNVEKNHQQGEDRHT